MTVPHARTPTALLRDPAVTPMAKAVYTLIDTHAEPTAAGRRAKVTDPLLARELGVSRDTIRRARNELRDTGWITWKRTRGASWTALHDTPEAAPTPHLEPAPVPHLEAAPTPTLDPRSSTHATAEAAPMPPQKWHPCTPEQAPLEQAPLEQGGATPALGAQLIQRRELRHEWDGLHAALIDEHHPDHVTDALVDIATGGLRFTFPSHLERAVRNRILHRLLPTAELTDPTCPDCRDTHTALIYDHDTDTAQHQPCPTCQGAPTP